MSKFEEKAFREGLKKEYEMELDEVFDAKACLEEVMKETRARAGECYWPRFILAKNESTFLVLMFVIGLEKKEICVGQLSDYYPHKGGDIPVNWAQRLMAPSAEQIEYLKTIKVPYFKPIFPGGIPHQNILSTIAPLSFK